MKKKTVRTGLKPETWFQWFWVFFSKDGSMMGKITCRLSAIKFIIWSLFQKKSAQPETNKLIRFELIVIFPTSQIIYSNHVKWLQLQYEYKNCRRNGGQQLHFLYFRKKENGGKNKTYERKQGLKRVKTKMLLPPPYKCNA